jgi:hypothetical protein
MGMCKLNLPGLFSTQERHGGTVLLPTSFSEILGDVRDSEGRWRVLN